MRFEQVRTLGVVGESGVLRYASQGQLVRGGALSPHHEAVTRSDARFQGGVRLGVLTSRIWFDGPETEHVDPAVEARHDRYDVDGIHGGGRSSPLDEWAERGVAAGDAPYNVPTSAACRTCGRADYVEGAS
jgi:hypothetical protein